MEQHTFFAIIVAGGSGKRMNSVLPKQFLTIAGKPIIMHTIEKFHVSSYQPKIILVLSSADIHTWKELVKEYNFKIPHTLVIGGKERFFSVKNGLETIKEQNSIIAIHDAVRPLVSLKTINNCYTKAIKNGNAVTSISSRDSVRQKEGEKNFAIPRDKIFLIQTPQTFNYNQLNTAYHQDFSKDFTDDASVVEKAGFQIFLEEGDQFNIKITYQEDLDLAEVLYK